MKHFHFGNLYGGHIPNVKAGSIATLIGKDGKEEITAPMVAESAESITNELLSRMGHRLNIIRRA